MSSFKGWILNKDLVLDKLSAHAHKYVFVSIDRDLMPIFGIFTKSLLITS